MFKELWRRTLGQPGLEGNTAASRKDQTLSLSSNMTHTGEFHLERLTALVEQRYGERFDEHEDDAIRHLIRYASRIQDQDIQRELLLFYLNCSPVVQDYLKSEDVFSGDHFISRSNDK
ncbi:hypothetical protein [Marinobacter salicampi]|uniref:hypothetical protein n=1 Tax=Marinobacter salicampi TaxID=435907 RepID=UPI001F5FB274|nr:hypothetical protein [Marinobacter salicampi]